MLDIRQLLILGGDKRQEYMALDLYKKGFDVSVFGISQLDEAENIKILDFKELQEKIGLFDAIILPLPASRDNKHIATSGEEISIDFLLSNIKSSQVVFAAMLNDENKSKFFKRGIKLYDYYEREDIKTRNAYPTAQGVLKIILDNLPICLNRMKCLVTGCGKTAQAISLMLKSLDVKVTIAARKCGDIAWAENNSMDGIYIKNLKNSSIDFDVVINTVPYTILDDTILSKINRQCLLIEIASKPYGIDLSSAQKYKIHSIIAGSLPGKTVPKAAGEIISDTISYMIKEGK